MKCLFASVCHCLKLIPIARLSRFVRIQSRVIMSPAEMAEEVDAVPGTIKVSTAAENGNLKKKITFECSGVAPEVADVLERYKAMRLVAVYVDESGRTRVAGSPDWPLSLDYSADGGVFAVTLQGEDLRPDAFLMV